MKHQNSPPARLAVFVTLWLLLSWLSGSRAFAENLGPGGGTRIIVGDEVVGPYRLLITVAPEPAQVGPLTFVVRISDPQSGDKVRDAEVSVVLSHGEDGLTLTRPATHGDAGNPVDYAAHVMVDRPGTYDGTIRILAPAGQTQVTFTQRVLPRRQLATLIAVGLPFLVILGVLAGVWLARAGSRPSTQSDPITDQEGPV